MANHFSEYFRQAGFLGSQGHLHPAKKSEYLASAVSPVLDERAHAAQLAEGLRIATKFGRVDVVGPRTLREAVDGVYSLAQWQSGFKTQNNRGTCWAFAGAAALEAAYRRKYGMLIDVSEEYVFHMGKAFALNRDGAGAVVQPVENNSSLTGFQGSGDIAQKISENASPPEDSAPYLQSQRALLDILPVLGFAGVGALVSQEDYDAIEFCEQHIPLLARVNARYRATGWGSLGNNPSVASLENTILADREVICDVFHKTPSVGGHVLLLIGFDRNRQVFMAKNHWGEGTFIEIAYNNDPNWQINSGWYITDVIDQTFVQSEACWLGNWRADVGNTSFRIILRRSEDFANPGTPTKLGTAYLGDGPHDVNGVFLNGGAHLRMFVAPTTAPVPTGTLSGWQIDADLNFADIYNAGGRAGQDPVALSRFNTRFAALFDKGDGSAWQARHGLSAEAYQSTFDLLVRQGYRLTYVCGYSEGTGARFNAVWQLRNGPAWQARHGLTNDQYQMAFDNLLGQGFKLVCVSGYAENGQARYAAIWEQRASSDWQARHGMSRSQYQQTFDQLAADGYAPVQVCGYRVNVDVRFAGIWERRPGLEWVGRHGLTSSEYQKAFDEQIATGYRLASVSGYSDTGIARYVALWHKDDPVEWQARHGLDSAGYQRSFDDLVTQGFRPVQVCGYGDGFYPA
jgi:hypothetical protein